jgi:UDP-N-acetylmuramate: L-alanyl-gamma-D-glutamyl-meso-diaminopimelate ligase
MLEKIPEGERFSSEELVQELERRGRAAHFFSGTEEIIDFLVKTAAAGDMILIMSNGGFDNIHERLLESL